MECSQKQWIMKSAHKVAMILVIIGAVNWGLVGGLKVNLVERLVGRGLVSRLVYVAVGLAALSMMFYRDTYLPFLGESVFPCSLLSNQTPPGATREVIIQVRPGAKVLYWATEPTSGGSPPSYIQAYGSYQNAGVTTADEAGRAILRIREPQPYTIPPFGRTLTPHIHYRVCGGAAGFIGQVKSLFL
jgi:uncharacterized membrane protein YuzA (DUF378 family)